MGVLSRDLAIEFLAGGTRTGKLATASPAGAPHVAPVWFLVDNEDLVFTTGRDTVKGRNLRANPRAALSADIEEFPDFRSNLRRLASLYARVSYSELPPPADTAKLLEQVWVQLVHGVEVGEAVAVGEAAE